MLAPRAPAPMSVGAPMRLMCRFMAVDCAGAPLDPAIDLARSSADHEDRAPYNRLRGQVHASGGVFGVVLQGGREVAARGEPDRADLSFSVAKTCLCMLVGVAHGQGLLPDVDEPVVARVVGIDFDSGHIRRIRWCHLLEQISEWEGNCFGLSDAVDRWRQVLHDSRPVGGKKGDASPLQEPGSYWEHHDVRMNQLALALLHCLALHCPRSFARP